MFRVALARQGRRQHRKIEEVGVAEERKKACVVLLFAPFSLRAMTSRKKANKRKAKAEKKKGEEAPNAQMVQLLNMNGLLLGRGDYASVGVKCEHGLAPFSDWRLCVEFVDIMRNDFCDAALGEYTKSKQEHFEQCGSFWEDTARGEWTLAYLLANGTQQILNGSHNLARRSALLATIMEQNIAVFLAKTQADLNIPKIWQMMEADEHTLISFFRKRIPCSCLDEKYKQVKSITKMSRCFNPGCSLPGNKMERSATKCCTRCRQVNYCSRQCQVAHWKKHRHLCDKYVATMQLRNPLKEPLA